MLTLASTASARLELPALSPAAQVMQRVGLTDITVTYSSPAVRGRVIWGKLVPFGKNWRTGANAATTIRFSRDVKVGGKSVKAGTYSIFTIPAQNGMWTVVLNSNTKTWGNRGYKRSDDVARVKLKTEAIAHRERMTFIFADTTDDGTTLALEWEKVRLPIKISVDTKAQALANIKKTLSSSWRPYFMASRYFMSIGDMVRAEKKAKKSMMIKETWGNQWLMAQILAKKGDKTGALAYAKKALAGGGTDAAFVGFYRAQIKNAVAKWSK
ncbi:MAG: DUF2911 domain-containing protein [Myxococcales bacterium]|nr:DUF2911 domain-containing protein [Myxococcales bacterium]